MQYLQKPPMLWRARPTVKPREAEIYYRRSCYGCIRFPEYASDTFRTTVTVASVTFRA